MPTSKPDQHGGHAAGTPQPGEAGYKPPTEQGMGAKQGAYSGGQEAAGRNQEGGHSAGPGMKPPGGGAAQRGDTVRHGSKR